ncbi:MAG: quinone-dependent dihydroorotate dehydrogenase [Hyphomicrobiales bacterium]
MIGPLASLAMPFLRALDPEHAHDLTLKAMEAGLYPRAEGVDDPRLAQELWGLRFPNPLGIAAGFDKDARVFQAILDSGFGFAEAGTLTPLPQAGNPKPRIFRLPGHRAMINRLGFNNGGHTAALARLRAHYKGIVGVNVGANKDASDRVADYVQGLETFWDVASYFTINVSSPNTPGLRDLQAPSALNELLGRLMERRANLARATGRQPPLLLKLAPDIADEDLPAIVEVISVRKVDGVIVSNTTLSRKEITGATHAKEAGGLSGRPLFLRSTRMLAQVYRLTSGKMPLVGVGGIDSPRAAIDKIEAGASLLQLYTGLVYEGPSLIGRIKSALADHLSSTGTGSISSLAGRRAAEWAGADIA